MAHIEINIGTKEFENQGAAVEIKVAVNTDGLNGYESAVATALGAAVRELIVRGGVLIAETVANARSGAGEVKH